MPKNVWKTKPLTLEYEARAKNLLKGELKRRGLTYAQLAEKLEALEFTRQSGTSPIRSAEADSLRLSFSNA